MVLYTQLDVTNRNTGSIVTYTNWPSAKIKTSSNVSAGTTKFTLPNDNGLYSGTFLVGDTVSFYIDQLNPPTGNKVFNGFITRVTQIGQDNQRGFIDIQAQDFTRRLQDTTATEVYNNQYTGSIVKDLMLKYVSDVSYSGVTLGKEIPNISFKRKPIYDCIKQLAEIEGFNFFVDVDQDLKYRQKGDVLAGGSIVAGSATSIDFKTDRSKMFNRIWVYGDRYLTGERDTFTAFGGSVFVLDERPHNTFVQVGGSVIAPGGIFEMNEQVASGTKWLVSYNDRTVTFTSGTSLGYNIPTSGNTVQIDYQKSSPVIKFAEDLASVNLHGAKEKVIVNKEITDPIAAKQLARSELLLNKDPKILAKVKQAKFFRAKPAETIQVDYPEQGIAQQSFEIVNISYDITPKTIRSELVMNYDLEDYDRGVDDIIAQIIRELKELKASDIDDTGVLSRGEFIIGSINYRIANWKVWDTDIGASLVCNHPVNGRVGSVAGLQPLIGYWGTGSELVRSGGTWT